MIFNPIIVVDTREQKPFSFPRNVKIMKKSLYSGDYSVSGFETYVAVERKSLDDLIACCGRERERFEKEIQRLQGIPVKAIVVEASWADVELGNYRSRLNPNAAIGSCLSWIIKGVPIIMAGSRERACQFTLRILMKAAEYKYAELKKLMVIPNE